MSLILYHYFFIVLAVCFFGPSRTPVPTALAFVCASRPMGDSICGKYSIGT